MSLALLDAMGSGICVLTTDTPENREAIADAGFTFKRGDVQDLQRMLTMLLNDDDLRQTTGRLAQERVRQHYLWDDVAKEIEAHYLELMQASAEIKAAPHAVKVRSKTA